MTGIGERPRELKWYHAGPMLFGDWGTSRLYVLGLAFLFTGRASFWFICAMSVLLLAVGWCYTIACRLFPDGGGVYSSAKMRSQLLALVGTLLLAADYVVTASLSCLDAFHYLGIHDIHLGPLPLDGVITAVVILAIGALNFFGPTKTSALAMWVAIATVLLTLVIGIFCIPHLGQMQVQAPTGGVMHSWVQFTGIILALSGVEAIANMTGIMVHPVEKTAKKSILIVMFEIIILNLILAAAMCALPDTILYDADGKFIHNSDMLKVIASYFVHPVFATVSSVVFAALLLSAVNTAVGAQVSILFMLSRDKELPTNFSKLNRYGMPKWPLLVAMIIPAVLVIAFPRVDALADMYAVGTVGAIAIDLGSIATNFKLDIKRRDRGLIALVALVLTAVELTILVTKAPARGFALVVLVTGLAARLATIVTNPASGVSQKGRYNLLGLAIASVVTIFVSEIFLHDTWTGIILGLAVTGVITFESYRIESARKLILEYKAAEPTSGQKPRMLIEGGYKPKKRIMVATQGNPRLIKFAFEEAKRHEAELQFLFIRHLAVIPTGPVPATKLEEDQDALNMFNNLREQAHQEHVPIRLLYGVARDLPDTILDMAVTHGADMLLLGSTRRGTLWKTMKGDVIQGVAEHLPENVGLLIHA